MISVEKWIDFLVYSSTLGLVCIDVGSGDMTECLHMMHIQAEIQQPPSATVVAIQGLLNVIIQSNICSWVDNKVDFFFQDISIFLTQTKALRAYVAMDDLDLVQDLGQIPQKMKNSSVE